MLYSTLILLAAFVMLVFIIYLISEILNIYSIGSFVLKTHCKINDKAICKIKNFNSKQLTLEQYNLFNYQCKLYSRIEMPCRKCKNHFKLLKENAIFI